LILCLVVIFVHTTLDLIPHFMLISLLASLGLI